MYNDTYFFNAYCARCKLKFPKENIRCSNCGQALRHRPLSSKGKERIREVKKYGVTI